MLCNDNKTTQCSQIQITQNNKFKIQSIPNNSCIYPKSYKLKNQNKNSMLTTNNNPNEDLNIANNQEEINISDLVCNNTLEEKSKQNEKNCEDNPNMLLSDSNILDNSKNDISNTNSIIFNNKEKTKEGLVQSALCNYFDKTPVNINMNSEKNNENINNNVKCNLNKVFSNLNSDKKTPIKYSKNQFHNKSDDDYYGLGNNSIKNHSFNKRSKNNSNISDNYNYKKDDRKNLFQKYEIDNEMSNVCLSNNKNNEKSNFDYFDTDRNISSKKKEKEKEKLESKMEISDFFAKKDYFNDEIIEKQKYTNYCIENIGNINIENHHNINLHDNKNNNKIVVNRANFYTINPKINTKNSFTNIGITNFSIKLNGVSKTNNVVNTISSFEKNNDNNQNNTKTIYHNYIYMNNNKQRNFNSPVNSNSSTVVHVSNQKQTSKLNTRNSRNNSHEGKNKKSNFLIFNGKIKSERSVVNKLNFNLSSRSSSNKNKNSFNKNDKKKKVYCKQIGEKIKNILNKRITKNINDTLKANNNMINKIKIKKIDILLNNKNTMNTINTSNTKRLFITKKNKYDLDSIKKYSTITNTISNSFRNKKQKLPKLKINIDKCVVKCHSHRNTDKKLNKDLSKNQLNNKIRQKKLDGNNFQTINNSSSRFSNKNNINKPHNNIAKNIYLIPTQRSLYNNASNFLFDTSNKMNNNLGKDINESQKSNTSRNTNNNIIREKYFCNTQLMNANRRPTKIIQNFSCYNKKKNNDKDIILDNEDNMDIKTNSFI